MNDKKKVIVGLIVLLIIGAFPVWYTLAFGGSGDRPELVYPEGLSEDEYHCVESVEFMRGNHMELLNQWRDAAVRQGERFYTSTEFGTEYEMSLTRTCMSCHTSRADFCTRCHDFADVDPYCWDCHLEPEQF